MFLAPTLPFFALGYLSPREIDKNTVPSTLPPLVQPGQCLYESLHNGRQSASSLTQPPHNARHWQLQPQLPDSTMSSPSASENIPFLQWQVANTPFIRMLCDQPDQDKNSSGGGRKPKGMSNDGLSKTEQKTKLMEKLKALRNIRALEKGFPNEAAYTKHIYRKCAINAGFRKPDGEVDIAAYSRYMSDRTVIKSGFVTKDNRANRSAYNRSALERTAINAGFVSLDGGIDVKAYQRYSFEQSVRRAGYFKPDGSIDASRYRAHAPQRAAIRAGFILKDGTADVSAYRKHRIQKHQALVNNPDRATSTANYSGLTSAGPVSTPSSINWP
jgi:hypothetical protein